MQCIYCHSLLTVRNGRSEKGLQRYKCNGCKRRFCEKGIFARMRFAKEIVMNALYLRSYPLSLRDVKRVLRKLKYIAVSHVSIYRWILKFYPKLIEIQRRIPLNFSKIWHVDEKFIRVRGSKDPFAYLWVVSDSNSNIIAVHVSNARSAKNAKIVLKKAHERAGFSPEIIVTDGLQGYKSACTIFGRKCRHVITHFKAECIMHKNKLHYLSNNKIERINGFFALWLHVCRGLKSFITASLWIEFFAMHYNYLMPHGIKESVKMEWGQTPDMMETCRDNFA